MIIESKQEALDMLDYLLGWRIGEGMGTEEGKFEKRVISHILDKYPELESEYGWYREHL